MTETMTVPTTRRSSGSGSSRHQRTAAAAMDKRKPRLDDDDDDSDDDVHNNNVEAAVATAVAPPPTTPTNSRMKKGSAHSRRKKDDEDPLASQSEHVGKKKSGAAAAAISQSEHVPRDQYTETLKDSTHSRGKFRGSAHSRSSSASSAEYDEDAIAASAAERRRAKIRSKRENNPTSATTATTPASTRRGRSKDNAAPIDGYGSDHGMKRRMKSTRKKGTTSTATATTSSASSDALNSSSDHGISKRTASIRRDHSTDGSGYNSDHGMKRRVANRSTRRKDNASNHSTRTERTTASNIPAINKTSSADGYNSDHGIKRRTGTGASTSTGTPSNNNSDEDNNNNDATDFGTEELKDSSEDGVELKKPSSGRLGKLMGFVSRSKRRLLERTNSNGNMKEKKKEDRTKRSSSIGAMTRGLRRRADRSQRRSRSRGDSELENTTDHQNEATSADVTISSDEDELNKTTDTTTTTTSSPRRRGKSAGPISHNSPPRRHKSMDAGPGLPEFMGGDEADGRDPTAPVRAQSMMMHRERTRRNGKQESLVNVQEYTQEELPSTSYFASNHILLNRERMKRGMKPLTRNKAMDELAREHAEKMAKSLGCTPLRATFIGNVIRGDSIRAIHKAIMQNRDGRERYNILNPYFQEFGIGTCKGEDSMLYVCQLFSESIELACVDT